jgi:hypothetical protein
VFGSKRRAEKKEADEAAKEERARVDLRNAITGLLALADGEPGSDLDSPLMLRSDERLASVTGGAGLFEPRRTPGHWEGRSAGVSVPVGRTGLRVRVGKSAGTYVQGEEEPTIIDTGDASITTQRVVFQGARYTREWDYNRLVGVIHYSDQPCTAIQVSNRQKTSGIVYAGLPSPEPFRLALTVAVAIFHGEAEETAKELREELQVLDAGSGAAPASGPAGNQPDTPAAAWAADPSRRHQWRYWDGKTWTDNVADNGQQSRDPLPGGP